MAVIQEVPEFDPGYPLVLEVIGYEMGSIQPCEDNWVAAWYELWQNSVTGMNAETMVVGLNHANHVTSSIVSTGKRQQSQFSQPWLSRAIVP